MTSKHLHCMYPTVIICTSHQWCRLGDAVLLCVPCRHVCLAAFDHWHLRQTNQCTNGRLVVLAESPLGDWMQPQIEGTQKNSAILLRFCITMHHTESQTSTVRFVAGAFVGIFSDQKYFLPMAISSDCAVIQHSHGNPPIVLDVIVVDLVSLANQQCWISIAMLYNHGLCTRDLFNNFDPQIQYPGTVRLSECTKFLTPLLLLLDLVRNLVLLGFLCCLLHPMAQMQSPNLNLSKIHTPILSKKRMIRYV